MNVRVMLALSHKLDVFFAGAIGLKFEIIDLESVKELQIVCVDDGREVHSAEQLREHLGMGHGQMWLLREDKDLSPLARSVNVDRISPIISKLTTGDLEKNLLVWAKDKQHLKYLEVSPSTANQVHSSCKWYCCIAWLTVRPFNSCLQILRS